MRLGLLISGSLGNIVLHYLIKNHNIIVVLTDKKSIEIIEECKKIILKLILETQEITGLQVLLKILKLMFWFL